jgi:hypothetical protein
MRVTLGSVSAVVVAIAMCGACSGNGGGQAQASAEPQGEQITAVGCPVAGATPGCLTIMANGKAYDLAAANPAVDVSRNVGISVMGRAAGEVSACGIKLTNVKVDYLGISCGAPPPV